MRLASLVLAGVVLAGCAAPVAAQSPLNTAFDNGLYLTPLAHERLEDGAIAEVVHHNRRIAGMAGEVEFFEYETPHGLIIIRMEHTDNRLCDEGCPDTIEAWELPNGFIADHPILVTPEDGVGVMIIRRWQGM